MNNLNDSRDVKLSLKKYESDIEIWMNNKYIMIKDYCKCIILDDIEFENSIIRSISVIKKEDELLKSLKIENIMIFKLLDLSL